MAGTLSVGGKVYRWIERGPVRQDLFMMMQARHCGIAGTQIQAGESPDDFANRLLASVLASGRALLLLGGTMVPDGTPDEQWTEEIAYATAGHLGGLTDADEKRAVYGEIAQALLGFFVNGLGSWVASRRSSGGDGAGPAAESSSKSSSTTGTGSGGTLSAP